MAIEAMVIREVEVVSESPFYIPMPGPAATPRRALKHDDTFVPDMATSKRGSTGRCSLWPNDL
jgi:hypothetical protein